MEEKLYEYLNKNYKLTLDDIIHVHFGGNIYGEALAKQISLIFSIDNIVSEKVVKTWIQENITNEHGVVTDYWVEKISLKYYEPKRSNRFIMHFPVDFNIPDYFVKRTHRPNVQFINGFAEWNDIEITLMDPIGPSMAQRMHELFLRIGSNYTNEQFQYRLEILDPVGTIIEQWSITGYISSLDFGDLNYSLDELLEIKMVIRPTNVVLVF